jgi:hypothetical protein
MKIKILFFILSVVLSATTSVGQKNNKKVSISGVVLDSNQKPIPGAIIFIDNQRTNVTANGKGFYKIKVNPEAKKISVFTSNNGLKETEINGRTTINFILKTTDLSSNPQVKILQVMRQ